MKLAYISMAFFFCCLLSCSFAGAQSFSVPEHYAFNTKDDYHKYDRDIIKAINWIEKTTPGEEADRMKQASRFVLEWNSGCPYVHFQQNVRVDAFIGDSPEYRIYYIGGWVRYALKSKTEHPDKVQAYVEAIRCVLKAYKGRPGSKHDKNIEELAKVDGQGKLQQWVEARM